MADKGWLGVDLDGTLAVYDGWISPQHIGDPVAPMVDRVKAWIKEGRDVRIFTARVSSDGSARHNLEAEIARSCIEEWCLQHLDRVLPVTCIKDYDCMCIYDDRCKQVETNTGRLIGDYVN